MTAGVREVALPSALRERLRAFRLHRAGTWTYLVVEPTGEGALELQPWQLHALEILLDSPRFEELSRALAARHGRPVARAELEELLALVFARRWLSGSALSHPLVQELELGEHPAHAAAGQQPPPRGAAEAPDPPLPEAVSDALGLRRAGRDKGRVLLRSAGFVALLHALALPFRRAGYLLPPLVALAVMVWFRHQDLFGEDLRRWFGNITIVEHAAFGLLTDNLLVTLLTAVAAFHYGVPLGGFGVVFYFAVYPRFMVRLGSLDALSRRQRIRLHAAPLLLRLALFSLAVLVWFGTRTSGSVLARFCLALCVISQVSFLLTANPLMKSHGYELLTALTNQPRLKERAFATLTGRLRGERTRRADGNLLFAYALAVVLFLIAVTAGFLLILGIYLKSQFGGPGLVLLVLVAAVIALRLWSRIRKAGAVYDSALRYSRWGRRQAFEVLPAPATTRARSGGLRYAVLALAPVVLLALFVPYVREPGGELVVLANVRQEIATDVAGLVTEVRYDGGELLRAGDCIARLSEADFSARVAVYDAKVREQQALLEDLRSRPRPEELQLARSGLATEETRARYSAEKLERTTRLHAQQVVTLEELEDARAEHALDLARVEEKRAELARVEAGLPPERIAAAEAQLRSLEEQREAFAQDLAQTVLHMPFSGVLVGSHLKQRAGSYLVRGEPLALAERTDRVLVEVDVPEAEAGSIRPQARLRGRVLSYSDEEVEGVVQAIDPVLIRTSAGRMLRVTAVLENSEGRLKPGMQGYAKIRSDPLPLWRVLSTGLVRFLDYDLWSWLP